MSIEQSFSTPTFTLKAPPDAAFNVQLWCNNQQEETVTNISTHTGDYALIVSIEDATLYLSPSPSLDHTSHLDVAVLDSSDTQADTIKSEIEAQLSNCLFITDQDYIERTIKTLIPEILTIAEHLEDALSNASQIVSTFQYVLHQFTQHPGTHSSIQGVHSQCESLRTEIYHGDLRRMQNTLNTVSSRLKDNNIFARSYPRELQEFHSDIFTAYKSLGFEIRHLNPESPQVSNIEDALCEAEFFVRVLETAHQDLQEFVKDYDSSAAVELQQSY